MKTVSAVEVVTKYLEEKIIDGAFLPDQRIKEQDISEKLNISRPPIREAFKILEGEGLIYRKPNKGVFVNAIKEKDIWELYSLREVLDVMAVSIAFDSITDDDIKKLEKIVSNMDSCLLSGSPKVINRYQELNSHFHDFFVEITNHVRLKRILSILDIQIRRFSFKTFTDKGQMRRSVEQHQAILKAIKKRDKKRALKLTAEHFQERAREHKRVHRELKETTVP